MKLTLSLLTALLLAPLAALHAADASSKTSAPDQPRTFCNPLPIPNYPVGLHARKVTKGQPDTAMLWILGHQEQFRELGDPTALWHEGKWYLYPSVDMAWVSEDNGATWQHHPLNVRDLGYSPTVVRHRGRFLLAANGPAVYASSSPLGPFEKIGDFSVPPSYKVADKMLFSDDDGRLYLYFGCSAAGGIWGMELDAADPAKALSEPIELITFNPRERLWEAHGEWNQNPNKSWIEGSWMLKRNGRYYLTYTAAGTEFRTYAMGCFVGSSPLGPFTPQKRNPILRTTDGLVTGSGAGSIVAGPDDQLWAFYTIRAGVVHIFERRIGMDRAEIDANGELVVHGATSLPQWLPGKMPSDTKSADSGWLPVNGFMHTLGSTNAPNLQGRFAVDNEMRTWWQPAEGDTQPTLNSTFAAPATIHAVRLIWRDIGLDTKHDVQPGPFRYRVELETAKDQWTTILDRSESTEDLLIDYRECKPTTGTRARLVILGSPKGITPGVAEFTVFGKTVVTK
jgi:xylan 1,4-beta-xylosidase